MVEKINIPNGGHDTVLGGDNLEMTEAWCSAATDVDRQTMEAFRTGRDPVAETAPRLAYAHVEMAAFSMCRAADILDASFDPEEFGRRCAAIAREQAQRYRNYILKAEPNKVRATLPK